MNGIFGLLGIKLSKEKDKKSLRIWFILGIIVSLFFIYTFSFKKPKAGFISGQSQSITQLPNKGNSTSIIINFLNCSRGNDVVYFNQGSTHFVFEGIKDDKCIFYYGTEVENPNWNGDLTTKCFVPVSVDKRTFNVGLFGIQMEEIEQYCENL